MAVAFRTPVLAAVAQSAKKAVQLFIENGLDRAADVCANPILDWIKPLFTCK
jgi:hypothetical protein